MEDTQALFEKAVAYITSGGGKTQGDPEETAEEQLQLYALEQQATIGENTTPRPGLLDFKGKAKWDAWKALEGVSKADAQQQYAEKVRSIHPKWEEWTGEVAAGAYVVPAAYEEQEMEQWFQDALRLKADEEGWEPPYINANGIVVTRKPVDSTGFKVRKETGVVKGKSVEEVADLFRYERRLEWDALLDKSRVVKELSATSAVVHVSTKSPSRVVWPRDFLVSVKWATLDDGTRIRVAKSIKDDKLVPPSAATHVRATMLLSAYICTPHPEGTHITDLKQVDGAGWIPVSMVEHAEKTSTVANIRKALGVE